MTCTARTTTRRAPSARHVLSLDLARTDGSRLICTPSTIRSCSPRPIGGLGLTGLILSATIQMRRVPGLAVEAEDIRFDGLADFFDLAARVR